MGDSAIRTFTGLLRSIPPTEPILLLAVMEKPPDTGEKSETREYNNQIEARMLRDLFGYSLHNQYELKRPDRPAREEFFNAVIDYIRKPPSDFPAQETRKRRKLEVLPVVQAAEVSHEPTKEEKKAQKKKDALTLNQLKLNIQSVMDQIKLKYKKFRTPIVEDRDIAYLYDEQNPQMLTTDLTEEQRQQQQVFRPYELDQDEKGVTGLREVVSGKFYYNLEIVTIEKRLSNGYYKRPKDFLADIKRLAKDARTAGDQDRTLKANEMLANVEVDMATLEQQQPLLVAECEAVYERDQQRERDRAAKALEAARHGDDVPTVVPNVPPQNASKTTTETSGPVMLGQEVPGVRPTLLPVAPSRLHMPIPWSTTNGSNSHQTNGSTVPSRPREDSEMLDSPNELYEGNSQLYPRMAGSPEQHINTQGELSQHGAHTRIAQGSQIENYRNSASTTTSGQKTSEKSGRSSDKYSINTQGSNGIRSIPQDHPPFSQGADGSGASLPDTQPEQIFSSQHEGSQGSQQMPPPPRQSSINNLLNDPPMTTRLILHNETLKSFKTELLSKTSGLSVEQLEQVNATLMDCIWKGRADWNRDAVLKSVMDGFNAVIKDIEEVQAVFGPSQDD